MNKEIHAKFLEESENLYKRLGLNYTKNEPLTTILQKVGEIQFMDELINTLVRYELIINTNRKIVILTEVLIYATNCTTFLEKYNAQKDK